MDVLFETVLWRTALVRRECVAIFSRNGNNKRSTQSKYPALLRRAGVTVKIEEYLLLPTQAINLNKNGAA